MFDIITDIEDFIVEKIRTAIPDNTVSIAVNPDAANIEEFASAASHGYILVAIRSCEKMNDAGSVGTRGVQYKCEFLIALGSKEIKDGSTLKEWMQSTYAALQNQKPTHAIQPGLEMTAFQSYHRSQKSKRWFAGMIFTTTIRTP